MDSPGQTGISKLLVTGEVAKSGRESKVCIHWKCQLWTDEGGLYPTTSFFLTCWFLCWAILLHGRWQVELYGLVCWGGLKGAGDHGRSRAGGTEMTSSEQWYSEPSLYYATWNLYKKNICLMEDFVQSVIDRQCWDWILMYYPALSSTWTESSLSICCLRDKAKCISASFQTM